MSRQLHLAVISKSNFLGGGASRVAEELATWLRESGHCAQHWQAYRETDRRIGRFHLYGTRFRGIIKAVHRGSTKLGFGEILPMEYTVLGRQLPSCELLHVHDISAAASPLTIALAGRRLPVIWTLHDCSTFTGGCLYPEDCPRLAAGCGQCPQQGVWPLTGLMDATSLRLRLHRYVTRAAVDAFIAPSAWMRDQALKGGLPAERIHQINYGMNLTLYTPQRREAARNRLSIGEKQCAVLIMAGLLSDPRKGVAHSLHALRSLNHTQDVEVLVIGNLDDPGRAMLAGMRHQAFGYLRDDDLKADILAASDVLLAGSIADNSPLTILEAMASGVAVTAFAVGGIPEQVEHGVSGMLAQAGDADDLARKLRETLQSGDVRRMGQEGRLRAERLFSRESFLERHIALYETLIARYEGRDATAQNH